MSMMLRVFRAAPSRLLTRPTTVLNNTTPLALQPHFITTRNYAKKAKETEKPKSKSKSNTTTTPEPEERGTKQKLKATSSFIPGSQQPITDEAALAEYGKAETAMKTAVEWFRKECAASETRVAGRVTPALLSPVRVKLPDNPASMKLEEVATVGVREGSTLIVTLFDEHTFKHVEAALYDSNIPGVTPQRQDSRTIKIPIPKPTVEARTNIYAGAKRKAEEIRVQIRKQHGTSIKKGKYEKHSIELEEFQKLTDKYVKETDLILANLQKATGAK